MWNSLPISSYSLQNLPNPQSLFEENPAAYAPAPNVPVPAPAFLVPVPALEEVPVNHENFQKNLIEKSEDRIISLPSNWEVAGSSFAPQD
jgi:hypothetical protein